VAGVFMNVCLRLSLCAFAVVYVYLRLCVIVCLCVCVCVWLRRGGGGGGRELGVDGRHEMNGTPLPPLTPFPSTTSCTGWIGPAPWRPSRRSLLLLLSQVCFS
jgi:hypothetical protein